MESQRHMEEEDNIIVKWAQEDVETSYNLLNNKNKILRLPSHNKYFGRTSKIC